MKKRLISIFIAVLLILGNCVFVLAENGEKSDEFSFLSVTGFGLDLSDLDKVLTRAELAQLAINLKKVSIVEGESAACYDVPEKHWAFPVVSTVMYYDLMEPKGDGLFKPDDEAGLVEGSRILLGLLGYDQIGKAADWTDSDYYNKARSLGLLNGVNKKDAALSVRDLAKMSLNLLEIPVVSISSIGEEIEYAINEENTYAQEAYGYKIVEGTVQAVGKQALSGIEKVSNSCIKINGEVYVAGGNDYLKYLGMDVKAIVDEEKNSVIAITTDTSFDELTVLSEDIISYSDFKFRYYNDKEKEDVISVPKDCEIILNGQTVEKYNERDFVPQDGDVRFVDKDNDGEYEVVYITSAIYFKLSGIYENDSMLDSVTSQTVNLKKVNVQCYKGGVPVGISQIKAGDVVEVRAGALLYDGVVIRVDTENLSTLEIEVLDNKVSGTVSAVYDDGESGFEVDGKDYEPSKYYQSLTKAGLITAPDSGSNVEFYLNSANKIILTEGGSRFAPTSEAIKYGYLLGINESQGVSKELSLKIVNSEGKQEILTVAEKFFINDSDTASKNEDLFRDFRLYPQGSFKTQLIRYQMDAAGDVKVIHLAKNYAQEKIMDENGVEIDNPNYNAVGYEGYDDNSFAMNYYKENHTWNMNINHQYTVNEDTKVFVVPSDPEDMELWMVTDKSYLKNEGSYPLIAYDANDRLEFGAIVVDYTLGGTTSKNMVQTIYSRKIGSCMISGKKTKLMDGETITCLTGKTYGLQYMQFLKWEDVELVPSYENLADADGWGTAYTGVKFSDLEPGDVIEYELDNASGEVERFRILARAKDLYDSNGDLIYGTINDKGAMDRMHIGKGRVTRLYDDGSFMFATNAEGTMSGLRLANQNSALMSRGMIRVFIFNTAKKTIIQTTTNELRIGDEGFLRSELGQALDIFVYR